MTLDQVDAPGDDDHDESEDLGDGEHLLHLGCQLHIGTINSSQETLIININYYKLYIILQMRRAAMSLTAS